MAADGGDGQTYWALTNAATLAGHVKAKEEAFFDAVRRRGLDRIWVIAHAQAFGTDPLNPQDFATQTLAYTGPEGKSLRWRINEPRALVDQCNIIARGERPEFKCLTLNADFQSVAQIEIAQNIVRYLYRETVGDAAEADLTEVGGWFGSAYWWTRWDAEGGDDVTVEQRVEGLPEPIKQTQRSGAPKTSTLFPWEYCFEPYAKESPYGIVRERVSKHELAATYPQLAEQILAVNNIRAQPGFAEMFSWDVDAATTDDVIVRHFYLKPCAARREGRYVGILEDMILWDRASPHPKQIPVIEYCPHKYFGTGFGYAKAWDVLALQEAIDELVSQQLTNYMTFGMQNVFIPQGSNYDEDALRDGLNVFTVPPNSGPPVALALAEFPEGAQWLIEFAYARMNSIMGMNQVSRGQADETVKSGTHAALRDAIAIRFQNGEHAALIGARTKQANLSLDMVKLNATAPFLVEVAGAGEEAYLKQFTTQSVAGVRRVSVVNVSPLMQSQAGRMEAYLNIVKLPKEERAAALKGLDTGDFTGFTEKPKTSDMLIRFENEQLIKGILMTPASGENPMEHLPEHWSELEKQRSQEQPNMVAIIALQQHIQMSIAEWQRTDPFIAMCLRIPPPPPLPNTPAGFVAQAGIFPPDTSVQLQMAKPNAIAGAQQGASEKTDDPSSDAQSGGKHPAGVDLPKPAEPAGGRSASPHP